MNFEAFDLHPHIFSGVQALGYKTPTPIQQQSIPPILKGHDIVGLAQTGTGKTAAFALPILQRLIHKPRGQVRALILAPTRELAQQILETIQELGQNTELRCAALYGGVNLSKQKQKLRQGVEIIVACPGRLLDHLNQRTISLTHVEMLVLDEADQMLDMGFLPSIRKILRQLPEKRQSLLFSATMPEEVRKLSHDILKDPTTIQLSNAVPATTVKQMIFPVEQHLKTELAIKILQTSDTGSVLFFVRTKHRAKQLAKELEDAGYDATSLQGNLSQSKRQSVMRDFREGQLQILVATDIASRGIDVASISHVINYDMPATIEAYTHRIGRTGRAAKIGDAFTFVTPADWSKVRAIERKLGVKLEQKIFSDFDYQLKPDKREVKSVHKAGLHAHKNKPKSSTPNNHRRWAKKRSFNKNRSRKKSSS